MPDDQQLSQSEVGKTVVTQDGDEIGQIDAVQGDVLVVDAPEDLGDSIRSRLNWDNTRGDKYTMQASDVEEVTDDTVVTGVSGA